jgi:hypothetical protein
MDALHTRADRRTEESTEQFRGIEMKIRPMPVYLTEYLPSTFYSCDFGAVIALGLVYYVKLHVLLLLLRLGNTYRANMHGRDETGIAQASWTSLHLRQRAV